MSRCHVEVPLRRSDQDVHGHPNHARIVLVFAEAARSGRRPAGEWVLRPRRLDPVEREFPGRWCDDGEAGDCG